MHLRSYFTPRYCTSGCACTHTCATLLYVPLRSHTYVTLRYCTVSRACTYMHTYVMLRYCTFSCTCTRAHATLPHSFIHLYTNSCYASARSLALAHICHATVLYILLHLHAYVMPCTLLTLTGFRILDASLRKIGQLAAPAIYRHRKILLVLSRHISIMFLEILMLMLLLLIMMMSKHVGDDVYVDVRINIPIGVDEDIDDTKVSFFLLANSPMKKHVKKVDREGPLECPAPFRHRVPYHSLAFCNLLLADRNGNTQSRMRFQFQDLHATLCFHANITTSQHHYGRILALRSPSGFCVLFFTRAMLG